MCEEGKGLQVNSKVDKVVDSLRKLFNSLAGAARALTASEKPLGNAGGTQEHLPSQHLFCHRFSHAATHQAEQGGQVLPCKTTCRRSDSGQNTRKKKKAGRTAFGFCMAGLMAGYDVQLQLTSLKEPEGWDLQAHARMIDGFGKESSGFPRGC